MNQEYSVTQAANIGAFVGVIVILLKFFKVNIAEEEVQTLLGAAITIGSIIVNFINRYRKGDIRLSGVKKTF
ncbi:MAG: hypothetical protein ACLGJB_17875 [Blastocatellia bacterium]